MRLVELVRARDLCGVVRELGGMTPRQRVLAQTGLLGHRESAAGRRTVAPSEKAALSAAELGCRVTPEAAAAWLLQHRYLTPDTWTVEILDLRPTAWRAELAARLGARATASDTVFTITEHLVHDTGCPVPASHEFVLAWFFNRARNRARPARVLGGVPGADLPARLRADPFTPVLVPPAVARPGRLVLGRPGWLLGALLALAAEGVADRAELVRNLFADMAGAPPRATHAVPVLTALALTPAEHARVAPARAALVEHLLGLLLEDGGPVGTRTRSAASSASAASATDPAQTLAFLRALAPTPDENALMVRQHQALLDRPAPVADYAREVLTELGAESGPGPGPTSDEAGLLGAGLLEPRPLRPGMLTEA
ncbi:hypothetical protein QFZ75_001438 [Streptomyces sp. V3I8]|uniref:hypothetical protein n=1 Tax=Streptomyces sp. V3I8 TaxID=3042279 RepID=UPI002789D814|nr:hypothetical protein [Streptomyces sp. V3I8]MDQ1035022.1 hypothetical protein [Streptomyces sp. V3I8]